MAVTLLVVMASGVCEALSLNLGGTFPDGTVGQNYRSFNDVSSGLIDVVNWAVVSGTLPDGLHLSAITDNGQASLTGVPTTEGTYNFTLRATWGEQTQEKDMTINIEAGATAEITGEFPNGTVGSQYDSHADVAYKWVGLNKWEVISGELPPGLTLRTYRPEALGVQERQAELRGTPTKAGTYTFTVRVTNNDFKDTTATKTFTVVIYGQMTINSDNLGSGTKGIRYTGYLTVSGGVSPYTWSCERGNLPSGTELEFDSVGETCSFSGIPTAEGTYTFWIRVTDSASGYETKVASITINKGSAPTGLTINGTFPSGTVNIPYSESISVSGGSSPYTWSYTGTPPDGTELKYNESNGTCTLTGTPTRAGTFTFTVIVKDSSSREARKSMTVTISTSGGGKSSGGGGGGCNSGIALLGLVLAGAITLRKSHR